MNPNDVRKRQVYVKGTPLKDRVSDARGYRRDGNFVDTPQVENIEFDTFFDYEDDLSGLKPSNEQVVVESSDSMVMVPNNDYSDNKVYTAKPSNAEAVVSQGISMKKDDGASVDFVPTAQHGELGNMPHGEAITPVIMRPVYKKESSPSAVSTEKKELEEEKGASEKRKYDDVVGFDFVRCEYIMKNEKQCKRQAPKNSTICSIHKKMLSK